jgi:hypothetical protein
MKPAQIRVFDGLRITTDHVNHLQGALASGFLDFREILGLGEAQKGLDISVQDDGSVMIAPGVAFDFHGNRLACDDPLPLKLTFAPEDKEKFICLKYELVEDGTVEGHPTMIWDSCSALVRDALPDEKENLVTLARVVKDANGKLCVRPPEESPVIQVEAAPLMEVPVGPVAPESGATAGVSLPAPPAPALPAPAVPPAVAPTPATPAATPAPAAPVAALRFRQGVMQLSSDAGAASYIRSVLAPALRKKMGTAGIDLSFSLAQAEIAPDIAVSAFSTQCVLSGDLSFPAVQPAPQTRHHFECVANGEVTAATGGLAQFAACTLLMHPVPAQSGGTWSASDLTGRGAAQFSFDKWAGAPDGARPPWPADVLAGLVLLVQLVPAAPTFQLSLKLLWNGTISEESLQGLETQDIGFAWQVLFGWKAVGT